MGPSVPRSASRRSRSATGAPGSVIARARRATGAPVSSSACQRRRGKPRPATGVDVWRRSRDLAAPSRRPPRTLNGLPGEFHVEEANAGGTLRTRGSRAAPLLVHRSLRTCARDPRWSTSIRGVLSRLSSSARWSRGHRVRRTRWFGDGAVSCTRPWRHDLGEVRMTLSILGVTRDRRPRWRYVKACKRVGAM